MYNEPIVISNGKIHGLIRAAGLVAGLVILQQVVSYALSGLTFSWHSMPQLILANFGIVAGWYYIKGSEKKIPAFAIAVAAFCLAVWLRAVLIYLGLFRVIAPLVGAFVEKQFSYIMTLLAMPQFVPALFAALILLLLMPKAKRIYKRIISNGNY